MRFTRDVANITMDLNGVEHINFNALGGADNITVGDLSGTGVTQVAIDLARPRQRNRRRRGRYVTVTGTGGNDQIQVTGRRLRTVSGLAAQVTITGAEAANDVLTSTPAAATTPSMRPDLPAHDHARPSTAVPATTPSPAARATTR